MAGVLDVLGSLGGEKTRDGSWKIELDDLRLHSVFGGSLAGHALVTIAGDAVSFQTPPELFACGKMWMPGVSDVDGLRNAIVEAHGQLRERVTEGVTSLRRLGFKAKLTPPEPRARGHLQIDSHAVVVALDQNGDLVVEEVAGRPVPVEQRRALIAPDEATAEEAQRRVTSLVQAFWKRHGAASKGETAAEAPALSQAELDELQAALSDEDDLGLGSSDDEEAEPTSANVPPPVRRQRASSLDFDEDDEGTLSARAGPPVAVTAREVDDEQGTLELRVPPARPQAPSAKPSRPQPEKQPEKAEKPDSGSLLDAFDDDDDEEGIETTATSTASPIGGVKAAPSSAPSDDEENDLLAALDDDDEPPPPRSPQASNVGKRLSLDDFPAFEGGSASQMNGSPTSVNAPPNMLPSLPSAAPTQALMVSPMMKHTELAADDDADDDADGFDDGEGSEARKRRMVSERSGPQRAAPVDDPQTPPAAPPPVADEIEDDFDDGKTRALSVDQALLDKLKLGDGRASDVAPTVTAEIPRPPPATATAAPNRTPAHGKPAKPSSTPAAGSPQAAPPASAALGGFEPVQVRTVDSAPAGDASDASEDLSMEISVDDPGDAEIAALQLRADELRAELAAVQERIVALQAGRESTATSSGPGGAARDDGGPTSRRQAVNSVPTANSPPQDEAATVQRPALRRDAPVRDKTDPTPVVVASPPRAPKPRGEPLSRQADEDAFKSVGQSADDSAEEAATNSRPQGASLPSLASIDVQELSDEREEGGVSLADLQGALKDMGIDLGESGETQVAAAQLPIELHNDDGDVFGSSGGAPEGPDLSQEATKIRTSSTRPSSIALVVEDPKARDRLRKHLEPRFGELFEAENAKMISQLKELSRVDAIVFVRPSTSEPNKQGFSKLQSLPRRPRVLVISADVAFDTLPGVDLRLPLGQKASEVARQVLEGLERLGVSSQQV